MAKESMQQPTTIKGTHRRTDTKQIFLILKIFLFLKINIQQLL
jgi:hypothetical protein